MKQNECNETMSWFDSLQKFIKCLAGRGKFTHSIMKFKINDAIFFVHAHLSQLSFSNFSTDVRFSLSCIHFALDLLSFTNTNERFKRIQRVSWIRHWARSPLSWTSFLKVLHSVMRLKSRLTTWQRSFERLDSHVAGLCAGFSRLKAFMNCTVQIDNRTPNQTNGANDAYPP